MSSYAVAQPPPAKVRPGSVKGAVGLMWTLAVLEIASLIVSLLTTSKTKSVTDAYYASHNAQTNTTAVSQAVTLVIGAVVVAAIIVLAIFVNKGSQPARIVSWILGGLGVLCTGCGAIANGLSSSLLSSMGGNSSQAEDVTKLANDIRAAIPNWLFYLSMAIEILFVIVALLVIILLAVSASNDYFRKEAQVWVPPADLGGGYPQYPGYPQGPMSPPPGGGQTPPSSPQS